MINPLGEMKLTPCPLCNMPSDVIVHLMVKHKRTHQEAVALVAPEGEHSGDASPQDWGCKD